MVEERGEPARPLQRVLVLLAGLALTPKVDGALAQGAGAIPRSPQALNQPPIVPGKDAAGKPASSQIAGTMATTTYATITFEKLPGWAQDDHLAALKAFVASCPRILSGRGRTSKADETDLSPLQAACRMALALPGKLTTTRARAFFEHNFQPHRVVHDAGEGLFTAYYEPILDGSRTKEGRFQTPLLKRPPNLVTVVPETQAAAPGTLTHARQTTSGVEPYATRSEIESGALAGQGLELLYLADPVDKFFLQVQGSGRIRLPDGTYVRVQYDGKNGHPYSSIGRYLIDNGLLAADKLSLGAVGRWLKADVERARHVMNQNASYVFFKEMPATAEAPHGAIDVPLIAGRSLAIDPGIHRLGSPIYVSIPTLKPAGSSHAFNRLMVAHDVGSAIRGPERGDVYFGSGKAAERAAGGVKHPGNLFVFLANPDIGAPGSGARGAGPARK